MVVFVIEPLGSEGRIRHEDQRIDSEAFKQKQSAYELYLIGAHMKRLIMEIKHKHVERSEVIRLLSFE